MGNLVYKPRWDKVKSSDIGAVLHCGKCFRGNVTHNRKCKVCGVLNYPILKDQLAISAVQKFQKYVANGLKECEVS